MTVSLYLADIRPLAGREAALLPLLTRQRCLRLEALQNPADRLHCLAAGLLLRQVLAAGEGDVAYDGLGKPRLTRRRDLHFSLSHGGDYAVLATAAQPVGVDIEPIPARLPRCQRRCCGQRSWPGSWRSPRRSASSSCGRSWRAP